MFKNKNMVLSYKCSCGPSLNFLRNICVYSVLESNHYKALGLTPSATQAEIKSAYYELSKKYHPDKNQGSEKSAELFRDITAAYEILGNEKSRRQYDREHLLFKNMNPSNQTHNSKADYNYEFERMYYEKRKRYQNASKIYYDRDYHFNFETWYRAHYVDHNKFYNVKYGSVKKKYRTEFAKQEDFKKEVKKGIKFVLLIYFLMFAAMVWSENKFDRKK